MNEPGETPKVEVPEPETPVLDLSKAKEGRLLPQTIKVEAGSVGGQLWQQMMADTNRTQKEHGITISQLGKRILTTGIQQGVGEWTDPQTGQKYPPQIIPPGLPHGPLSFIATKIAFVHTHPDESDSNVRTKNRFGKSDISAYLRDNANTWVMLNADGVHMLIGKDAHARSMSKEIAKMAHENVDEKTDTDEQIRAKVARKLAAYGVAYYYSASKTFAPDGTLILSQPK